MAVNEDNYYPGLEGVSINSSALSVVDGQNGRLHYCGYSIEDLAENCSFEEVSYLLLHGKLPNTDELEAFEQELIAERYLDAHLKAIIVLTPKTGHPMMVLQALLAQLAMHDPEIADRSLEAKRRKAIRIIAKMPLVVTYFDNLRRNMRIVQPSDKLGHAANILWMLTGKEPTEEAARLFDVALILHMDHGCNNSTFTNRVITSTEADIYAAMIGGIGSLSGPLHGGANERVINMLESIEELDEVEPFVDNLIENKQKIMGFGHRVYKVMDPRAVILRELAKGFVVDDPVMNKCLKKAELFEQVTEDRLQAAGKTQIWPNVDFFSGVLYKALGLEKDFFTPTFAIARVVGWLAHHFEQLDGNRIYRPRLTYNGPELGRGFTRMEDRD